MHRARLSRLAGRVSREFGLAHLAHAGRDAHLLLLSRFLRMTAFGAGALVLALYLAALGHSDTAIGLFMSATLLADGARSLALTVAADGLLGRRRTLALASVGVAAAGVVFATVGRRHYWALLLAAVLGVVSPGGKEVGPFRAVEESTLAHLTPPQARPYVFAWCYVLVSLGAAVGLFGAGVLVQALQERGWPDVAAYRAVFWVYAGIGFVEAGLALALSRRCELAGEKLEEEDGGGETEPLLRPSSAGSGEPAGDDPTLSKRPRWWNLLAHLSPATLIVLLKLGVLFALDSLGSGMIPHSLVNFFMDRKFAMPKAKLGTIMSITQLAAASTNLFAASLATRIGLIPAMVLTHLPSAVFLALIPIPAHLAAVVALLIARASLSSMDQAPRAAFLSAVVRPAERTAVMGILNVVKTVTQSVGPYITGVLAGRHHFWVAFVVAGSLKAAYDVGIFVLFFNVKFQSESSLDESTEARRSSGDSGDEAAGVDSRQRRLETGSPVLENVAPDPIE